MVDIIQPSMAAGEVSLEVEARVDLSKRRIAGAEVENFTVAFTGGLDSRAGLQFVARCKKTIGNHRLVPFQFNKSQTFILELGNLYMRFHTNGAQVLSGTTSTITGATQADPVVVTDTGHPYTNGDEIYVTGVVGMTQLNGRNFLIANSTANTYELQDMDGVDVDGTGYTAYTSGGTVDVPYEISTPWAEADIFELRYARRGDVVSFVHPDYDPRDLNRVTNTNWTLAVPAFKPIAEAPTGLAITTYNSPGAAANITNITQASPGVVTTSGAHGLSSGDQVYVINVLGMVEVNRSFFRVTTLTATTLELRNFETNAALDTTGYAAYSSGGQIRIAPNPRKYTVTAISDGEESLAALGDALTISNITQAEPPVVTVTDGHGLRVNDIVRLANVSGMTEVNANRYRVSPVTPLTFELRTMAGADVDSTGFGAYVSGGTASFTFIYATSSAEAEWENVLRWTEPSTATDEYQVYSAEGFGVLGFLARANALDHRDVNTASDLSITPPIGLDPFEEYGTETHNPRAVGTYQQRRIYAGTTVNPNRYFMSRVAQPTNFSSSRPAADDDAIINDLDGNEEIPTIEHILALSDLVLLTSSGEFRVTGQGDGPLTPKTTKVIPQTSYGATSLRPIVAANTGLITTPGPFVRSISYNFADDKFIGQDLTILARHLFKMHDLVDWTFAPSPYSLCWAVRSDGVLLSFTYQPEQEVFAWARHTTLGSFKSTATVREGDFNVPYFIVSRTMNGRVRKFIERLDNRRFDTLPEAFCVDAGLSLNSPITISGFTSANPVVVTTATSHGLSNGDYVDISGIYTVDSTNNRGESLDTTDINGTGYTVANVTATTFELQNNGSNVDGTAFAAYSSAGEVREAIATVSGLWHLEGAAVAVAANGYSYTGLTVANGSITLPSSNGVQVRASIVHVGLGYTCRFRTLDFSSYNAAGETLEAALKNVQRVYLKMASSMGAWVGPTAALMREVKFGVPSLWGQPLAAVSSLKDIAIKPDWARQKSVIVEQRAPLPLTLNSITLGATIGGSN